MRTAKASNRSTAPRSGGGSDGYYLFIALISVVVITTIVTVIGLAYALLP